MATRRSAEKKAEEESNELVSTVEAEPEEEKKPIVPKAIDPNETVVVRNGFQGRLVYRSKRTGERWVWDGFNSEQEIELKELKSAKNTAKSFFENNWFMFEEPWVVEYLGVQQYYRNSLRISQFDDVFKKKPAEIRSILSKVPAGQKKSVAYRAKELIASGEIDSRKTISVLEDALGIELIEQ